MAEQQPNAENPPPYWGPSGQPGHTGYPSGQQGYPYGQSENSQGQPKYQSGKPGYPPGQPGFPAEQPGYPAGKSGYPAGQPGYPTGQPGYSPGQPGCPPGQPGYPPGQPGYLPGQPGYPPGQPGYPPGPYQPQVINQQPGRILLSTHPNIGLSPNSFPTTCPACHRQVQTVRTQEYGPRTHFCALVLCLFCLLPCALIPYCLDSCKDVKHHCPECSAFIGTYYKNV